MSVRYGILAQLKARPGKGGEPAAGLDALPLVRASSELQHPGEIRGTRPAGPNVRGHTRIKPLSRRAILDDQFRVHVQDIHRLIAADVAWVCPQEHLQLLVHPRSTSKYPLAASAACNLPRASNNVLQMAL